jgi:5-methyltetrahydrofolate--homocysteine methyltransferase
LAKLLDIEQIGISLTENGAMYPQASICGVYLASPHARYFVVRE